MAALPCVPRVDSLGGDLKILKNPASAGFLIVLYGVLMGLLREAHLPP